MRCSNFPRCRPATSNASSTSNSFAGSRTAFAFTWWKRSMTPSAWTFPPTSSASRSSSAPPLLELAGPRFRFCSGGLQAGRRFSVSCQPRAFIRWPQRPQGDRVTKDDAWNLANHWVAAWNAHDLDSILAHYDDAVELTSPVAAKLLGTPEGKVVGKVALRAYFQRGLEAYPELRFHLEDVLWG